MFGSAGKLWADIKTFRNDRLPGVAIIRNFGTERPMSGAGISQPEPQAPESAGGGRQTPLPMACLEAPAQA